MRVTQAPSFCALTFWLQSIQPVSERHLLQSPVLNSETKTSFLENHGSDSSMLNRVIIRDGKWGFEEQKFCCCSCTSNVKKVLLLRTLPFQSDLMHRQTFINCGAL